MMKCDPYLNVDPGTMSPYQHGEVYVTDDGAETDLDLGHYERFTHCETSKTSNITTGKIYGSVIAKERRGDYLGRTVQVIPHITDEIKASIRAVGQGRRRGDRRDRRHRRRHRGPAVPRGHPPVPPGRRARQRALRPPHAGALHRDRRRAEDQADAAQRARAARHRHLARRAALPHRPLPLRRHQGQARAVLRRPRGGGRSRPRTWRRSTRCRWSTRSEGLDEIVLKALDLRSDGSDMSAWEELVAPDQEPAGRGRRSASSAST